MSEDSKLLAFRLRRRSVVCEPGFAGISARIGWFPGQDSNLDWRIQRTVPPVR